MATPTRHVRTATDPPQGENLSGFLHRINFSLDSVVGAPRKASSSSLNGAPTDHFAFKLPPLQDKTNGSKSLINLFTEGKRHTSFQDVSQQSRSSSVTRSSSLQGAHTISATAKSLNPTRASSSRAPTPNNQRSDKARHDLPVYALSQTLRASSIGATMAPGIPNDTSGLGWSKYAPADMAHNDENSKTALNQRTAETIARQAEIDARLSKLRSRRDPVTEQRDEDRRLQLVAAEKAAGEKQARMKADRDAKKKEEAASLVELERLHREKEEAERLKRKKEEEAERIKHEKEEAERIKREKEEAERIKREKEEAERIKREKEEAERIQREKEEAERIQREKAEAERLQREKEAERIQREKKEAEEAALRAMLYDKIDEIEEAGLTETHTEQMDLQDCLKKAAARQEEILTKINGKMVEIEQAKESLKLLEDEHLELKDLESSITAQIEVDNKKCADLQTVSEQIMERAADMRKKVDDKLVRSVDMIESFVTPDQNSRQAGERAEPAPEHAQNLSDDQSAAKSIQESKESTEELAVEISTEVKPPMATGPGPKSNSMENGEIKENLEHRLTFEKWPSQEDRPFGGAQKRLVKLTNLPTTSSIATIQSFVWGGRIEKIDYTPGNVFAWVLFMRGEDCEKYLSATGNGIVHPEDPNRVMWVEIGDPISVNEHLRGIYDAGHTRCVRAVGADEDWGKTALIKLASAKGRKLERVVNGANPKGLRVVEFRFANIVDSARFKVELQNDIDWEHCNVYFGDDPCATNDGVHMGVH